MKAIVDLQTHITELIDRTKYYHEPLTLKHLEDIQSMLGPLEDYEACYNADALADARSEGFAEAKRLIIKWVIDNPEISEDERRQEILDLEE